MINYNSVYYFLINKKGKIQKTYINVVQYVKLWMVSKWHQLINYNFNNILNGFGINRDINRNFKTNRFLYFHNIF